MRRGNRVLPDGPDVIFHVIDHGYRQTGRVLSGGRQSGFHLASSHAKSRLQEPVPDTVDFASVTGNDDSVVSRAFSNWIPIVRKDVDEGDFHLVERSIEEDVGGVDGWIDSAGCASGQKQSGAEPSNCSSRIQKHVSPFRAHGADLFIEPID